MKNRNSKYLWCTCECLNAMLTVIYNNTGMWREERRRGKSECVCVIKRERESATERYREREREWMGGDKKRTK